MAERYSKLFSLPENLYAQGSPVVIAAGALLKDDVTGNMLAQLKIQNISDKPIKAVKVAITPLDSVGRLLGGEIEYQYLDLSAKRDDFFGVKTPVALPDATTRSYTVRVVEVAFADNSLWNEARAPWETLPKQLTLVSALGDEELAEQYKEDIGNSQSAKEPTEHKDLWLCACGAINRSGEPCHKCHKTFAELTDFDIEKLKENFKSRIEAEARYQHIQKQKKRRRFVLAGTLTAVLIIIVLLLVLILTLHQKKLIKDCKIGDTIHLGEYEQDNNLSNGKEEIEWIVLAKENNRILVISKYALECQYYDGATWEESNIRQWLNGDFLNTSFSFFEKILIATVDVQPDSNLDHYEPVTRDKVFLLNVDETDAYFNSSDDMRCVPTAYVRSQESLYEDEYYCLWWLRTKADGDAVIVYKDGDFIIYFDWVSYICVRPAMWIDLG